jgi:hypothetical protein
MPPSSLARCGSRKALHERRSLFGRARADRRLYALRHLTARVPECAGIQPATVLAAKFPKGAVCRGFILGSAESPPGDCQSGRCNRKVPANRGEITGAALEIEAEVELTMHPRDREEARFVSPPQINTARAIGSVAGYEGVSLADCARAAYLDLLRRLERFHGFRCAEAYELLSAVGRLDVGNMIDPFYSVLASIERRYL